MTGLFFVDGDTRQVESIVDRMASLLVHRGPDDAGIQGFDRGALGHRRLSIVDLAGGHQPLCNEDGTVWVTYNGEIYNHVQLRNELEQAGHRFRTRCDTEVLVHLYEQHGTSFPSRLRGMFACALWDDRRKQLVLVRDRLGIKPLYYAKGHSGEIVFASEVKALFASGVVAPTIDATAINEFFLLGFTPHDRTLFANVLKLQPGELLIWRDGRTIRQTYWGSDLQTRCDTRLTLPEATDYLWALFKEAVELRLMSDVPLGVFLSGGMDSGLIVAAMRAVRGGPIATFTVGAADSSVNECAGARAVATAFETDHHEIRVEPAEFFGQLPSLSWVHDFPMTFSASQLLYAVSEAARAASVKVILTGEGSDELFAGYGRYARGRVNLRLATVADRVVPSSLRRYMADLAQSRGHGRWARRFDRSFVARKGTLEDAYLEAFAVLSSHARHWLLQPHITHHDPYRLARSVVDRHTVSQSFLRAMLQFDRTTYLQELLMKQDRMSMAASVESRVPFLDHVLVEWADTLPDRYKLRSHVGKVIVREIAKRELAGSNSWRTKRGFVLPLASWLASDGVEILQDYAPDGTDEYLRAESVRALCAGPHGHTDALWAVLAFQVWRREVVPRMESLYRAAAQVLGQGSPQRLS